MRAEPSMWVRGIIELDGHGAGQVVRRDVLSCSLLLLLLLLLRFMIQSLGTDQGDSLILLKSGSLTVQTAAHKGRILDAKHPAGAMFRISSL